MTREEEIRQAWAEERRKRVGTGEMVHFDSFLLGAFYADEHQRNPWRDAKKDQPKEGVNLVFKTAYGTFYGGYDANKECFFTIDPDGECWNIKSATHWMPIPELKKE